MTQLKREAIAMIEKLPDDVMEPLLVTMQHLSLESRIREAQKKREIFARLDELFAKKKSLTEEERAKGRKRAAEFDAALEKLNAMFADDRGWESEEEMLEEIMQDRRAERARLRQQNRMAS